MSRLGLLGHLEYPVRAMFDRQHEGSAKGERGRQHEGKWRPQHRVLEPRRRLPACRRTVQAARERVDDEPYPTGRKAGDDALVQGAPTEGDPGKVQDRTKRSLIPARPAQPLETPCLFRRAAAAARAQEHPIEVPVDRHVGAEGNDSGHQERRKADRREADLKKTMRPSAARSPRRERNSRPAVTSSPENGSSSTSKFRIVEKSRRQEYALPHALRVRAQGVVAAIVEQEEAQQPVDPDLKRPVRDSAEAADQLEVFGRSELRVEMRLLGHVADAPLVRDRVSARL